MTGVLDPHAKIGRNSSCPCGSGKKYKHCCLRAAEAADQSPWRKQHEASDRLSSEMIRFARNQFGSNLLEAWEDFNQESFPQNMDKFPGEEQIFMPYLIFDWDPERPFRTRRRNRHPGIVAREFLEKRANRLGELEKLILFLRISKPLSFYEVLHCEPGSGMRLRDVLIGGETEVEEHSASRGMQVGDILYAQLCPLPEVTALGRMAPTPLRPGRKAELVKLRAWLRKKAAKQNRSPNEGDLTQYEERIRTEYLNARDAIYAPPRLCNTDGDPFLIHTMRFRVGSAQVAFDALAPLAWGQTKPDLMEDAEVGADGVLRSVSIQWTRPGNAKHKHWDNTILGNLKIEGRTLTASVNSANRAKRIRKEIEKRLGIMAVYEGTSTESQEELMEAARRKRATRGDEDGRPGEREASPEAQEALEAVMRVHAENWLDTKLPALEGCTPREAVTDADGKEIVEGILLEWERRGKESPQSALRSFDINVIRKSLGL